MLEDLAGEGAGSYLRLLDRRKVTLEMFLLYNVGVATPRELLGKSSKYLVRRAGQGFSNNPKRYTVVFHQEAPSAVICPFRDYTRAAIDRDVLDIRPDTSPILMGSFFERIQEHATAMGKLSSVLYSAINRARGRHETDPGAYSLFTYHKRPIAIIVPATVGLRAIELNFPSVVGL